MTRMLHWLVMFSYLACACAVFAYGLGLPAHELASWIALFGIAVLASDSLTKGDK